MPPMINSASVLSSKPVVSNNKVKNPIKNRLANIPLKPKSKLINQGLRAADAALFKSLSLTFCVSMSPCCCNSKISGCFSLWLIHCSSLLPLMIEEAISSFLTRAILLSHMTAAELMAISSKANIKKPAVFKSYNNHLPSQNITTVMTENDK